MNTYLLGGPLDGCVVPLVRPGSLALISDDPQHPRRQMLYRLLCWRHPVYQRWAWCYTHPTWEFAWLAAQLRIHLPITFQLPVIPEVAYTDILTGPAGDPLYTGDAGSTIIPMHRPRMPVPAKQAV